MRHVPVSPFSDPALPHSFAEELTSLRSLLLTRRISQHVTSVLCDRGADVEAVDTYGYRPLHRMASNNLAVGAAALLEAGANPHAMTWGGETALEIAINSDARDVVEVLEKYLER